MRILDNGVYRDATQAEIDACQITVSPTIEERVETLESAMTQTNSITLPAASWTGSTSPYSQVVSVDGATSTSRIDLQPTPAQIASLQDNRITLTVVNDSGTITAYAIAPYVPTVDYTMQITITNVESGDA